ncbi:NADP-dependent oxidoreductase [Streptomyces orinoci]|uniref:NADP-dependent oxidoreductase n=1 Tax=Streptomyces orinoci TaxID=67339 RepID=A0ABV3JX97_STRON|nr:NADP-dependent oxidoreductase [Streptomyces orinoci]
MRAIVVRKSGGPEVLEMVEVPLPPAGTGQIRIRVAAAAVNPVDIATRSGLLIESGLMPAREVTGIGWDVAGTVDEAGPGVTHFAPGDQVIGLRDRLDVPLGTYAEYVTLDATAVAPAPAGISAAEAATIPLNGLTALQALDALDLGPGATLLVTGAAGAVGGFAVELAARRGIRVAASAGAADEPFVRAAGAHWFVPRGDDLADRVRELVPGGVDAVLDAAVLGTAVQGALRNRGSFASVVAGGAPVPLRGSTVTEVWVAADPAGLAHLSSLAAQGQLTLRVADTLPLEQAVLAHTRLSRGGIRGRLVLTP